MLYQDWLMERHHFIFTNGKKNKYEVIIYWSKEDDVFIAHIPELKGCMAHGDTPDDPLKEVNIMAEEWMELAKENGWQIPEPKGRLMFA